MQHLQLGLAASSAESWLLWHMFGVQLKLKYTGGPSIGHYVNEVDGNGPDYLSPSIQLLAQHLGYQRGLYEV
jgi:hypothetical protein